jgi:replicative DNA helicase
MSEELNFQALGDRLPPQNIEAEEAILGGIMLDPEAINRVYDHLVPEAFYISAHKDIYQAMQRLHSHGKPTDLLSVINWLIDHDMLARVGGRNKLASIVDRTVSAVNIDVLAELVMEKFLRRQLIKAGYEIVQLAYQTGTELPILLDQAEQRIFGVTQERPQEGLVHISDTLINTFQDIEAHHQSVALPGISSGFYDLDASTSGFQRSDLIIVAGRPSMGKCVSYDTNIVLADGSTSTIEELFHRHQAELLTLGNDWKFHLTQPSAFVNDGIKPVFSLTTGLGRYVETTMTHPYLTIKGWHPLSELRVGDKIAVPRNINIFGTKNVPECEVKLLAYLMGDSYLTDSTLEFTNTNPLIQEDFSHAVTSFSQYLKASIETSSEHAPTLDASRSHAPKNPLTEWLMNLGLWCKKADEKIIPSFIFQLECQQVSLFLNRLFGIDGWASVFASGQPQLGYCSQSEKLARQVQHLLLRFGIIAALKKQFVKCKHTYREAWQLEITDAQSIKNFILEIGIFSKEEALAQVESVLVNNVLLQQLATSDIYWDEIVSIESVGHKQVYDLTIPETHNFVANDICVHNTAFCLNLAHNVATVDKLPVAIFSLEMSKSQLVQRLLATEAGIEISYLRSGRIIQTQWEPLSRAIGVLSEMPIYIDDTPNITVTEMRSQARRLQAEVGTQLGLIIIDYLQLMEGAGDNRVQELSKITRNLKSLGRELNVPVIALSQLSRGVESRTNKRPMLSDLRESGSIEQDADIVLMLYRDEYYNSDTPDRGIAELIIAKHRNGPTGTVKLLFDPQFTKFKNLARQGY